jgi:outer membrane murein-binding lipoprotein Lpp
MVPCPKEAVSLAARMRAGSIIVLTLVLAGCSGDSKRVAEADLPTVVLQPADLAGSFERFDEGRQASADQPEGARSDATRFGRIDGWKSRYRRRGGVEISGPLVIESRADLFESPGGAEDELDEIARERAGQPRDRDLGEEAIVVSTTQAGFPRPLRTFVVSWRSANVVATVTANGFQGRVGEADVLRLARRQQARITAAAD